MTIRIRAVVSGQVQGVGFRVATARSAERAGAVGFVRNLPDGTVQAEVEGDDTAVEQVLSFVRIGPPSARVDAVDSQAMEPRGDARFDIR